MYGAVKSACIAAGSMDKYNGIGKNKFANPLLFTIYNRRFIPTSNEPGNQGVWRRKFRVAVNR